MKIAYLSGAYIPSRGANSMHVMQMCEALARLGHDVRLYVRPGDLHSESDFCFYDVSPSFSVEKLDRPGIRAIGAAAYALRVRRKLLRRDMPDLIYAREFWSLSLALDLGVPFVFESHWSPKNALQKSAERRILRHPLLHRVVFISEALRQIYYSEFPWLDPAKTVVAHDAARATDDSAPGGAITVGRRSALQVGYVGSFHVGCGLDLIEKVASLLPDVDFNIFGGSADETDAWTKRTSGLENLRFHGFRCPADLPPIYRALDIVVAPYQPDTPHIGWISPMKLFEYMAHAGAIVCSDFPVLREIIDHEVTGVLVEPDSPETWAEVITGLRDDVERRRRLGTAAQRTQRQNYTWLARAGNVLHDIAGCDRHDARRQGFSAR